MYVRIRSCVISGTLIRNSLLQGSPVCVNVTPLQVELLEKDLQDTKISLQVLRTENQYFSEIIEEQKKLVVAIIIGSTKL